MKAFYLLCTVFLLLAGVYGYLLNCFNVYATTLADMNMGLTVFRIIGIFVAPLGAVMGLFF